MALVEIAVLEYQEGYVHRKEVEVIQSLVVRVSFTLHECFPRLTKSLVNF